MPPRFFSATPLPQPPFPHSFTLDEAGARHVQVLRLAEGDAITLFDGVQPGEAKAIIQTIGKRVVTVEITAWGNIARESPRDIALLQALASGDKMDLIIQKAVELGVTAVLPFRATRSTLKLDAERAQKRVLHWRAVAVAACEQCGRNVVPNIADIKTFDESLLSTRCLGILHPESAVDKGLSLFSWGQANAGRPLGIVVGPEGGFTEAEISAAIAKGATLVTLGPRVLRTETAGLAALAILQSMFGDLG